MTLGTRFAGGTLSWSIGIGSIVDLPGIFRVRNRCCGRVDLENAGSWYRRMSVLRMYSCCILVLTSGLRFTLNCTTCIVSFSVSQVSWSISSSLSQLSASLFFVVIITLRCFSRTLCRFREVREVGRVSVSSFQWRAPLHRARVLEQAPPLDPYRAPWVVRSMVSVAVGAFRVIVRALYVLPALFAHVLGWSAEVWSVLVQCTHLGLRLRLRVGCVSSWQLRHLIILFVST